MTILSKGSDFNKTIIHKNLVGLYYYVLDKEHIRENDGANSSIFSYVPTIQTISFNPFMDLTHNFIEVVPSDFDESNFGTPNASYKPMVYRVKNFIEHSKELGKYKIKIKKSDLTEDIETRLLFYPFKYYTLCDYLNPPLILKPELLETDEEGNISIQVKIALSQTSKYNLFVKGYKGDNIGNKEGINNNNPLLFPVGSSAYAQFLATQGNTFNQSNANALAENDQSYRQNIQSLNFNEDKQLFNNLSNAVGSALNTNVSGVLSSVANNHFDTLGNQLTRQFTNENRELKEYSIESMALARKKDYLNTPRTMKTLGNDSIFNMALAQHSVDIIEYDITYEYKVRINSYFKRYGYLVNRYGVPNLKSRKYWNFIKMKKCDIDSNNIPNIHIQELERIFESGITFWHIDNGAIIKDYYQANIEV